MIILVKGGGEGGGEECGGNYIQIFQIDALCRIIVYLILKEIKIQINVICVCVRSCVLVRYKHTGGS